MHHHTLYLFDFPRLHVRGGVATTALHFEEVRCASGKK